MKRLLSERHDRLHVLCLSLLLYLSLISGIRLAGAGSDPAAEQTARLQQLRTRIGELKNDLGSIRGEKRALDGELEKTEKEIGTLTAELRGLERKIDASQQQLDQLGVQRASRQRQLQEMRSDLIRDLRSAYHMGKQEQVKLLLNQEDPALVGRMLVYHDYFGRARARHLRAIRTALDDLAAIEQEVVHQKVALEKLRMRQLEESRHLEQMQSQRKAVIARLQTELEKKSGELTTLQKDEQNLQQLVQSLQAALREIPSTAGQFESFAGRKGRLLWPVTGRIGRGFGVRHAEGKLTSRGIFLRAPGGTEVHAISRGRVAFADWLRGFGLLLILDHGSGYMSLYGHNSSLFKEPGEWVEENEVIALVGSSGGQQHTGLYLELRKHGHPFDPGPWFAGKPEQQHAAR